MNPFSQCSKVKLIVVRANFPKDDADEQDGHSRRSGSRNSADEGSVVVYAQKWKRSHKNAFYNRPMWLDRLPPFANHMKRTSSRNPYEIAQDDIFDYHHFYLRKCQGLLSIADSLIRRDQASAVMKIIMDAADIGTPQDLISGIFFRRET